MAEATPAAPGTEQAPKDIMSRLAGFLDAEAPAAVETDDEDAGAAPAQAVQNPEGQASEGELTADDLPDETTPAEQQPGAVEMFEFVAAGEKLRLPRDEVIKLAQQGHDYVQKTMALAEQARTVQDRLARVSAIEQVHPQLKQAEAQVQALVAQLAPYQRVDWVAMATNDPLEYNKVRASYDVLLQTYQGAAGQYQSMQRAIGEQKKALDTQALQIERQKLSERIPEWKDPEKFKEGAGKLRDYLISEGATPDEVDGLTSSMAVAIAYKAMRYDALLKAKAGKVKLLQTAPPVTRPGAGQSQAAATADKEAALRGRLKKTGDIKDAAALLMGRLK